MLMTMLKWISACVLLSSLYWFPDRYRAALVFGTWTVAIAVLAFLDLPERLLWIPVTLGVLGVFGSMIVLSFPTNIGLTINLLTLVLFGAAVDVMRISRRSPALIKHRTR
jgi:hypothetical protein